ncbi:hypothetical protein LCGC14_2876520 [marine sediment metagenome]|uniref:Uncharacterized protein n=1 Tax=marine sediment metagenome TaxID=412755 RepID=A0A0F9ASJ8_9ZZZZ|nr:hypothetical protein [Bacteroides sp.]
MQNKENQLVSSFHNYFVLTMEDFKNILQTTSRMTVFRKLKHLSYKTSYSHCGKYYTLDSIANYDNNGIWAYNQIYFSKFGTLKNTVLHSIEKSSGGFTSYELEEFLRVPVHNTVFDLWKNRKIRREQITKQYIYLSVKKGDTQFDLRKQDIVIKNNMFAKDVSDEYLALFMSLLNEKQKRLFAGYESIKTGYGGDKIISRKTGLNIKTVSRGRKELLSEDIDIEKIRKTGAGRPSLKKTKKS